MADRHVGEPTVDTADEPCAKRPRQDAAIDPRSWSAELLTDSTCTRFTLKGFFGNPDEAIPSWVRTQKKSELQQMLREQGFAEASLVGTKDVLIDRLKNGKAYVTMQIDGRECLQRVLNVLLSTWGWDDQHTFSARMPKRGSNLHGCKKLNDDDDWHMVITAVYGFPHQFGRSGNGYFHRIHGHFNRDFYDEQEEIECCQQRSIKRWLEQGLHKGTLRRLCSGRLTPDDYGPYRKVRGAAFKPGNVKAGNPMWFEPDSGGALSLETCALRAGDQLLFLYDGCNVFSVQVCSVTPNAPLIEEAAFRNTCNEHFTRAVVIERGGAGVPLQYGRHGGASEYEDEDEDEYS